MDIFLEFEKPIAALEKRLQDLRDLASQEGVDLSNEIRILEKKCEKLTQETFSRLSPWQKVQLSRHPSRPHARDYIDAVFPDFMELKGDRLFGDDQAIIGGIATWPTPGGDQQKKQSVVVLGHQKGRTTKLKLERNFGMARPEGYRKAMRLMDLAQRFQLPLISLIDTPGAFPGLEAEARGQSQAIAESIEKLFELTIPTAAVIIGEGGSGGALALGVADLVLMQEYSVYSVISPESCASILWSDSSLAERAANKLKMSAGELFEMKVIDAIIPEPKGASHRNVSEAAQFVKQALIDQFQPIMSGYFTKQKNPKTQKLQENHDAQKLGLRESRFEKFRKLGNFAITHLETN